MTSWMHVLSDIILWSVGDKLSVPVIVNSYVGMCCSVCFDIRYYIAGKHITMVTECATTITYAFIHNALIISCYELL